jgi:hypothetical protein
MYVLVFFLTQYYPFKFVIYTGSIIFNSKKGTRIFKKKIEKRIIKTEFNRT